jgi:hypothetical protein
MLGNATMLTIKQGIFNGIDEEECSREGEFDDDRR